MSHLGLCDFNDNAVTHDDVTHDDAVAHDDAAGNTNSPPGGASPQASEMPEHASIPYESAEREACEVHVEVVGGMDNVEVAYVTCNSGGMVAPEADEMVAPGPEGLVYQIDGHDVEASDIAVEEANVVHSGEVDAAFKAERLDVSESETEALAVYAPNEAFGPLDESSAQRESVDPADCPPSKKVKLDDTAEHHSVVIPTIPSLQDGLVQNESYQHASNTSDAEAVATHESSSHRKPRKEFTASEKLAILSELDAPNPPSIKELLAKYGLSKSSFHRWRSPQVKERLLEMARSGEEQGVDVPITDETEVDATSATSPHQGELVQVPPPSLLYKGNKKRDMSDGLLPLKRSLQQFIEFNASLPQEEQYAIRSAFLQVKARELRNELVRKAEEREVEIERWKIHHEQQGQHPMELPNEQNDESIIENDHDSNPCPPPLLTPTELKSLQNFKGSKSWSCQIASQLGLLTAPWSEASEANSRKYLEEAAAASSGALAGAVDVKKPKKARMEFTASDKVRILKEIDESNIQRKNAGLPILTVEEICETYGTSKSSLHRWRQQHKSGQLDAALEEGCTDVKRIFKDKLSAVKAALAEFVAGQEKVDYLMLQQRALEVRDDLLKGYEERIKSGAVEVGVEASEGVVEGAVVTDHIYIKEEEDDAAVTTDHNVSILPGETAVAAKDQDEDDVTDSRDSHTDKEQTSTAQSNAISLAASKLTEDEYQALRNFKASMSWLREVAKKYNWTMDTADDAKLTPDWRLASRKVLYENYYPDHRNDCEEEHNIVVEETQAEDHHGEVHHDAIVAEAAQEQLHDEHLDEDMLQAEDHNEVHYDLVMAEVEQPPTEDYELQVAEILESGKVRGAIHGHASL
ncbi:hypothetical protein ACHAW6_009817 [Cyclotella cf. meneghiniana]